MRSWLAGMGGREGGKRRRPSVLHPSVFAVARGKVAAGWLCRAVEVPLWVWGAGAGAEGAPTADLVAGPEQHPKVLKLPPVCEV